MPVTFSVAKHHAARFPLPEYKSADRILDHACRSAKHWQEKFETLQSSINPSDYPAVAPTPNGFVETVLEAYGRHRNLVIRPDDVWIAILVQFQFYVNANAEKLRSSFVPHEGKKELTIVVEAESRHVVDFGWFATRMSELLHENVVDKDLVRWILPDFTTTTDTDTTVCAIVLMATTKKYFDFAFAVSCGIPQVTLDGEKQDWIDILSRLDKLANFGEEPLAWSHLLRVVLTRFISAFDTPDSVANVDFWQRVANIKPLMCGEELLSGWITAFCVWDKEGKWTGPEIAELLRGGLESTMDPVPPPDKPLHWFDENGQLVWNAGPAEQLVLDGRPFPAVDFLAIPPGYASVPVKVEDHGEVFECEMIAGHIGWHVLPQTLADSAAEYPPVIQPGEIVEKPEKAILPMVLAQEGKTGDSGFGDTVQPASAWFIIERKAGSVNQQLRAFASLEEWFATHPNPTFDDATEANRGSPGRDLVMELE